MRYVLIALGIVFTVIAFTGAVLPLLPTTPFLILAAICFTNSSRKFKIWLESTQIYKNYVENLKIQRVYYERKNKNTYKFIYCSWFFYFYDFKLIYSNWINDNGRDSNNCIIYIC